MGKYQKSVGEVKLSNGPRDYSSKLFGQRSYIYLFFCFENGSVGSVMKQLNGESRVSNPETIALWKP